VAGCRAQMDAQLAAYRKLVSTATEKAGGNKDGINVAIASFESYFLANLILVLDNLRSTNE
jgi:hypothetical protein